MSLDYHLLCFFKCCEKLALTRSKIAHKLDNS
jgi:hypothetical protein